MLVFPIGFFGGGSANGLVPSSILTKVTSTFTLNFPTGLANNGVYETTFNMSQTYLLLSVVCYSAIRIRFYYSSTYQANDLTRPSTTAPTGDVGLVIEGITSTSSPVWTTINADPIPTGNCSSDAIPVTITNLSGSTIDNLEIIVTFVPLII